MEDSVVVALVYILLFVLTVDVIYIAMLLAPRRPTPYKEMRYEAGNLESGPAKAPLAMQYIGYILMLVALEPAVAIPIAIYVFFGDIFATGIAALVGGLVVLTASTYAYNYAKRVEMWRISS
ncbi:MAG: NADH-quinone oxidoreductase subunit A [Pyrobaculum sp.]